MQVKSGLQTFLIINTYKCTRSLTLLLRCGCMVETKSVLSTLMMKLKGEHHFFYIKSYMICDMVSGFYSVSFLSLSLGDIVYRSPETWRHPRVIATVGNMIDTHCMLVQ